MNAPCPRCDHVHPSDAAVAIGRFIPGRPATYRASNRFDAPIRSTRAAAVADWCDHVREVAS